MSSARSPIVVRKHSPSESSKLAALKVLLENGSKEAAENDQPGGECDGTAIQEDSAQWTKYTLTEQRRRR